MIHGTVRPSCDGIVGDASQHGASNELPFSQHPPESWLADTEGSITLVRRPLPRRDCGKSGEFDGVSIKVGLDADALSYASGFPSGGKGNGNNIKRLGRFLRGQFRLKAWTLRRDRRDTERLPAAHDY
jgi:hypothetical protein